MKKKIAAAVAVLTIVVLLAAFIMPGGGSSGGNRTAGASGAASSAVRTVTLERGDITSSVSATGTIYSSEATNVYSTLSHQVKAVHVSVGDRVEAGDVLAELDTKSIEDSIALKRASLSNSQQSQQQKIASAQTNLSTYQGGLQSNMNSSLVSAEASVASAELSVASAENELSSAWRKYRDARDDDAEDSVLTEHRETIESRQFSLEKAEAELEKAKKNLEIARRDAEENLASYQTSLKNEQANYNYTQQQLELQQLEEDLAECVITAPVSGTITAVNAVVGASGNGLLFVVQDTEHLIVKTNVKEYDIGAVAAGNRVAIKTDATGDREFEGTLSKIAPTSTLTATGGTSESTEAQYAAEVEITSKPEGLLIGMNARLSVVTEERRGVFTVPYEAVETDIAGNSAIYAQNTADDGSVSYTRIPVECGIESNLYIEISGDALQEGMQIVKSASGVDQALVVSADGMPVNTEAANASRPSGNRSGEGRPEGFPAGGGGGGGGGGMGGMGAIAGVRP